MAGMMVGVLDSRFWLGRYLAVCVAVLLSCLLLCCLVMPDSVRAAEEAGVITTRLVKIIVGDDSGLPIGYPSRIAFDHLNQEAYILAANGRITIYDKNFFPLGSIGVGRGVANVMAMAIGPHGTLYLSRQLIGADHSQRSIITIYNEALLVEREILVEDIPELAGFYVLDLAVAADGTIYLAGNFVGAAAGQRHRGVAVLDGQGRLQEWLKPMARVTRPRKVAVDRDSVADGDSAPQDSSAGAVAAGQKEFVTVDGVPSLDSVSIDVNGRIYLLSAELSEAFVYESNGRFHHKFGTKGGAKGKLSTPRTLGVDYPRRLIYVVDYMRHTILAYDYESGHFVYEFGGKGVGPLWYQHPTWLEVDNEGRVLVADLFNSRVQVVDPSNPERPVIEEVIPELEDMPIVATQVVELPTPAQLTGLAIPVQSAPVAPFLQMPDRGLRLMAARSTKKIILATPSQPLLTTDGEGPVLPGALPPPPLPVVTAEPDSEGASAVGSLVRSVRSVAGVYGPVAALLEVGSWLLRKDEK